jgi:hypothetical protein
VNNHRESRKFPNERSVIAVNDPDIGTIFAGDGAFVLSTPFGRDLPVLIPNS